MIEDIGRLTLADEGLNHQLADTFATVRESDRGWSEKVWGSFARKDGGLQIDFGLGKYANRNVMDAFGGVSRNYEQWTVRASRELSHDPETAAVGPIRYEILEPRKKVRCVLEPNKTQPIAFDVVFEGELPPFFEKRSRLRTHGRVGQDVVRYHQAGKMSGWLELDGQRIELGDDWFGMRDHSWGMRGDGVGAPPTGVQPTYTPGKQLKIMWSPWLLKRPDGSKYEIMHSVNCTENYDYFSAHVNHADGRQEPIVEMTPRLRFDSNIRLFKGGEFELLTASGETRHVEVTPLGDSGFFLRTAEYSSWKGGRHGAWRGEYHEDGEYISNILEVVDVRSQFRDKPVLVKEGEATGYGIQGTTFIGPFPEFGLGADADGKSNH